MKMRSTSTRRALIEGEAQSTPSSSGEVEVEVDTDAASGPAHIAAAAEAGPSVAPPDGNTTSEAGGEPSSREPIVDNTETIARIIASILEADP